MNWADELNLTKKQSLVILEKNKEIEIAHKKFNTSKESPTRCRFCLEKKARAFRELVSKCEEVKKK